MSLTPIQPLRSHHRGFTLVEAMLALLVASLLVTAGLEATGAAARAQLRNARLQFASSVADSLIQEITPIPFLPAATNFPTPPPNRSTFQSLLDYASLTESPPRARDGTPLTSDPAYSRTLTLEYVNPDSPTTTSASPTRLLRVTVTVSHNTQPLATRLLYKGRE